MALAAIPAQCHVRICCVAIIFSRLVLLGTWVLNASLSTQATVAVYAQLMQIDESFRDLKSEHFGLGFSASRSKQKKQLDVPLLIA